jgi:hypothetical protein
MTAKGPAARKMDPRIHPTMWIRAWACGFGLDHVPPPAPPVAGASLLGVRGQPQCGQVVAADETAWPHSGQLNKVMASPT